MGIVGDAIRANGNPLLINAYHRNGQLMEAMAAAVAAGRTGEALYNDAGVQSALAQADTAIRWFVWPAHLAEAGAIIGTIAYEMNWLHPDAGKVNYNATTIGARIGAKFATGAGFMQSRGNCTADGGAATMIGLGVAIGVGVSLYFFFRGENFLGFQVAVAVGVDIGVYGTLSGKFTAVP